jgi:F0F1-type ATP synthase assembly protein I
MPYGATGLIGFLGLQGLAVCLAAAVSGLVWSFMAGLSALLAGASVWLGSAVYASLLVARGSSSFVWVFVGQFVKVAVTLVLLSSVIFWFSALVWSGFLSGLFAALLAVLFAPVWIAKTEKKRDAQRIDRLLKSLSKE